MSRTENRERNALRYYFISVGSNGAAVLCVMLLLALGIGVDSLPGEYFGLPALVLGVVALATGMASLNVKGAVGVVSRRNAIASILIAAFVVTAAAGLLGASSCAQKSDGLTLTDYNVKAP